MLIQQKTNQTQNILPICVTRPNRYVILVLIALLSLSCKYQNSPSLQRANQEPASTGTETNPRCIAGAVFENESVDCRGARIGLSCNDDDEHQPPVMRLKNASISNLILKADGGSNGTYCTTGDCTLTNVVWEDICEDAASLIHKGRSMTIRGG